MWIFSVGFNKYLICSFSYICMMPYSVRKIYLVIVFIPKKKNILAQMGKGITFKWYKIKWKMILAQMGKDITFKWYKIKWKMILAQMGRAKTSLYD